MFFAIVTIGIITLILGTVAVLQLVQGRRDPIEEHLENLSIELAARQEAERERIFKETGQLVPRLPRMTFTCK